ncbi:MAG: cobalamin-binding protein [Firmicutes bacterium]|nr:cobalamin-binding protein [Bacillota bacterium]
MRKWLVVLLVLVLALSAVGCGRQEAPDNTGQNEIAGNNEQLNEHHEQREQVTYPLTVTDDLGREVTLTAKPARIVSLLPSLTEILFALEAGDRVVGVTNYCNYPEEAAQKDKVGDLFNLSAETILALQPDLVLTGRSQTLEEQLSFLENNGIPYIVVDPQSLAEIETAILQVAEMIDSMERGQKLVEQIQNDRAAFDAKVAQIPQEERARVFVMLDTEALFTIGDGEYLSEMIEAAGGINVAKDSGQGYFQISEETFFTLNPDVIIATFPMREEILAREAWRDIAAVKNGRVYDVDGDLVTRPGPRIVQGLEELYNVFTDR